MIEVPLVAKPGSFVCFFCGLHGSFFLKIQSLYSWQIN